MLDILSGVIMQLLEEATDADLHLRLSMIRTILDAFEVDSIEELGTFHVGGVAENNRQIPSCADSENNVACS